MKAILSPAKKIDTDSAAKSSRKPLFIDRSKALVTQLKKLSKGDISQLMKVSDEIAELNFKRFKEWSAAKEGHLAMELFKGETYVGLNSESFSASDKKYADSHLRILSGLYGLLRPLDGILPYRLEMGTKFVPKEGVKNLYQFWGDLLTEQLKSEMKPGEFLINLASNEYAKALNLKEFNVITPVFKKNGKSMGMMSKRARGMMANFIVVNRITDIEQLKEFPDFKFSASQSTETEWVYLTR